MKQNPVNQIELAPENTKSWIGVGLLLLSALGFTIAMLFANMAYKDGGSAIQALLSVFRFS
jgi:hypothetical protein